MPLADALHHADTARGIAVLRGLAAHGSIAAAARAAGLSYRAAWQALDALSRRAAVPLAERAVGGAGGGGARPTPAGEALLAAHGALAASQRAAVAGSTGTSAVLTSMRNQLPAVVERIAGRGALRQCHARLAGVAGAPALVAALTQASVLQLGLQPGLPVLLLCKAMAVRVGGAPATGALAGTVRRVQRAAAAHEVTLALADAIDLVGLAAPAEALRAGRPAWAVVDAAALVVALPTSP